MKLEHCVGAGEPLNAEVIRIWKEMSGLEIKDGYGQSETIMICGNFAGNPVKPGSMGTPTPGVPLHIIDPDGYESKVDEEGEIALECVNPKGQRFMAMFEGYLDDSQTPVMRLTPADKSGRKWYPTGDRGYRDKDGYIWFVGRSDDVIKSSGYRIGPFEVESTLKRHPAVLESAVVASPDPSRGELVKAFVVLTDEYKNHDQAALVSDIQEFCKREAAPYKYPRRIQFVDPTFLPKTISGKIRRVELRQMEMKNANSAKL